ncbi:alpha/beta hydrolase [Leptolyngbya cf. ectocarpi LEGE 11479]|uniref:prolyl aminopeptidase n=1 Tax=Leptolyngbya cf. ectocarpi LEGE 11479 TaxID=1828722 RepID=A0A928ZTZ4_LEPEC|nr:alpha/beta hydrolase [Leptolyngbya ectocarpi]MBE9067399.1 alpha/beta hydrolase [Leptolyngbya cf. ectocarpi LEGE 11479]
MSATLESLWLNWQIGLAITVGIVTSSGIVSAWLTPRGPITTIQALLSMAIAFAIGAVVGLITANRWNTLVLLTVFVAVFELARLGIDVPTVGSIHLGSTYGIIAFILGRLVHGMLVLLPMALGTLHGIWLALYLGRERSAPVGGIGWILTSLATLALIILAYFIAQSATTAPIVGTNGEPLPGSITELRAIPIGGHHQTVMIRGKQQKNPVLLYLAGGPGGTDLGAMRADTSLEQHFVVVTWDQRGTGKSYAAMEPVETLTLNQMVKDTIELTNYLRSRFDTDKIYLVGNSWGTILGTLAVQQHPELFYAYVGTGQMISLRETDILFYKDTIAWAEQTNNDALLTTLNQNGPPPYKDFFKYEPVFLHEHDWNAYPKFGTSQEMPFNLFVPENTFMDRVNGMRGLIDTFSILYPQLQDIDFRKDIPILEVPVYLVLGKYEARGRAILANEWFEILEAPLKEKIIFEHSGHRPPFEEPSTFSSLMVRILETIARRT